MDKRSPPKTGLIVVPAVQSASEPLSLTPLALEPALPTPLYLLRADGRPTAIVEILRFTQPYGSWLLSPTDVASVPSLVRDGNLTLVTRVDPLFAFLPLLTSARSSGDPAHFQPLSAVCTAAHAPDLSELVDASAVEALCDVKHAVGDVFFRLNDTRVRAWLEAKLAVLTTRDDVTDRNALDLLAHYLPAEWAAQLETKSPADTVDGAEAKPTAEDVAAAALAMQIMSEEARATNIANETPEPSRNAKKKVTKKPVKPKVTPSKSALKFWANRTTRASSARNKTEDDITDSSTKRKRTRSSTK